MEIYLMQHGEAVAESVDAERPLNGEGVAQVRRGAEILKRLNVVPEVLLCSPKRRSRQSAALVAETINYPYSDIVRSDAVKGGAAATEMLELVGQFRKSGTVMITGHLPSLARFAALLLGGEDSVQLRFDNGGLCRIDSVDLKPGAGELIFHLPQLVLETICEAGK